MTNASHFSLLVVDDEPDLRTLYELTLLREGYELDTAGTVEEALLHLKDRTYSAVITDMRLPDGSGLDVLRWLEESNRREKAIVITAYGSSENAVETEQHGSKTCDGIERFVERETGSLNLQNKINKDT